MASTTSVNRSTLRSVAIPIEHGGWMFLAEPALIGLGAGFSLAGVLLVLAALSAFLTRHPLTIALDDRRRQRRFPRTVWAERFAICYGTCSVLAFAACIFTAQQPFILPLVVASPLVLIQIYQDSRKHSRDLSAELSGSAAMGAIAASLLLLAGWGPWVALAVWLFTAARAVTSILYVRARLRMERGKPASIWPVWLSHGAAVILVVALAYTELIPWLAILLTIIWLFRAIFGLSSLRRPVRAQTVGIRELALGILAIVVLVAGYWFHL